MIEYSKFILVVAILLILEGICQMFAGISGMERPQKYDSSTAVGGMILLGAALYIILG